MQNFPQLPVSYGLEIPWLRVRISNCGKYHGCGLRVRISPHGEIYALDPRTFLQNLTVPFPIPYLLGCRLIGKVLWATANIRQLKLRIGSKYNHVLHKITKVFPRLKVINITKKIINSTLMSYHSRINFSCLQYVAAAHLEQLEMQNLSKK